jgi:hypothetical protein
MGPQGLRQWQSFEEIKSFSEADIRGTNRLANYW